MIVNEENRQQIKDKAATMSDFLRMEYLESCIKSRITIDAQAYCFLELSKLYESKKMYKEAIKYLAKLKSIYTDRNKIVMVTLKEIELLIKSGEYEQVELIYRGIHKDLGEIQRLEARGRITGLLREEAVNFEKKKSNAHALAVYENLLKYVPDNEKREIKEKILSYYNKLGRVRDSLRMENNL